MIQNDDVVVGAEVYAGVRNHVGPKVGMELAAGGTFLTANLSYPSTPGCVSCATSTKHAATISTAFVEGSLIHGPHGRFYVAPLLWAGYRGYSSSAASGGDRAVTFPSSGFVAGAGLRGGAFLGRTDSFDVHGEIRAAGGQERFVLITTGCSFAP